MATPPWPLDQADGSTAVGGTAPEFLDLSREPMMGPDRRETVIGGSCRKEREHRRGGEDGKGDFSGKDKTTKAALRG